MRLPFSLALLALVVQLVSPHQAYGKNGFGQKVSDKKRILEDFLNQSDEANIRSSWNSIKKNRNLGPKTFLRYFELKPEAQKMFSSFADIHSKELPMHDDFIVKARNCVSNLNSYVEHLGQNPKDCPFIAKAKGKYHRDDLKLLGVTLIDVLEEELGEDFTDDTKEAWRKGLDAMSEAVSKSNSS